MEAIRLRKEGLTPQQICTDLAWRVFNDKLVDHLPCLSKETKL